MKKVIAAVAMSLVLADVTNANAKRELIRLK